MNKAKENIKLVPEVRFSEFDEDWDVMQLHELGNLINGLTYSPKDVRDKGLLVLRSSNVRNEKIDLDDCVYVKTDIKGANQSEPNDILICVRNGSKRLIGKNALIPKGMPLSTHGAFMTVFRTKIPLFIFQLFQSERYRRQVKADLGATINSINGKNFIKYEFGIPPNPKEQQKIAATLTSLDNLIAAENEKLEALQSHKKGLLQQLFPAKGEKVPKVRFGEFSGEWEETTIDDIKSTVTDYVANGSFASLKENVQVSDSTDYAYYIRLTDLRAGLGHKGQKFVTEESYGFLKKSCLSGGELLMANIGANVGEIWQMPEVDKPSTLAPNMIMAKFGSKEENEFIFYFLNSEFGKRNISITISGNAHPKINKTEFKQVKVVIPKSKKERIKISNCLSSLDNLLSTQSEKLEALKEHKKGLMQQMFPVV